MFATQLIYIFLPRPSSLLLFKVWRLWCGTYYVGFGCSIVSPYFPLYFFSLLLKAWRPWRGTYNVVNIMVFRGLPQACEDFFSLLLKAWRLWRDTYNVGCSTAPRSPGGVFRSDFRHLEQPLWSPGTENLPASRHSEDRSVLRLPHDFLQRKKYTWKICLQVVTHKADLVLQLTRDFCFVSWPCAS